jgi:anti-sigma regulatory factor (Ser/Thr protein kinase)
VHDGAGFLHGAAVYAGAAGFVDVTASFVRGGLEQDEAVLVVVDRTKASWLRDELGADAADVSFADMAEVGRNPARIIPAWSRFVATCEGDGRRPRGIGEPIDATRSPAALRECHLHEALLDTAFIGGLPWSLLCPYDTSLGDDIIGTAHRTHRFVDGETSEHHLPVDPLAPFATPLPPPPRQALVVRADFDRSKLRWLRRLVQSQAEAAGVDRARGDGLVVAANELATNSVRHGGGRGSARMWSDDGCFVVEVSDAGELTDPLLGRVEPPLDRLGGRGLWLCNQICDLVQIHSNGTGTVIRLHIKMAA